MEEIKKVIIEEIRKVASLETIEFNELIKISKLIEAYKSVERIPLYQELEE